MLALKIRFVVTSLSAHYGPVDAWSNVVKVIALTF